MRIIVNKESGLSDIKTAIYYKSPIMPQSEEPLYLQYDPSTSYINLNHPSSVASQGIYYNSGELGCDFRFFEYGLDYFPESGNPLEALGKSLEDLLTKSPSGNFLGPRDLKDIGKYIIPTSISGTPGDLKYFGSFTTSDQEVYVFNVPEGISKIELFCEVLSPDVTYYDYDYGYQRGLRPAISIYLGVDSSGRVSQEFKGTQYILGPEPEYDIDSLGKLQDERECQKMVFFSLEQKRRYGEIEISTKAWTKLIEPLRNKPQEHLHSLSDIPSQITEPIEGLYFDGASGSVLGTRDTRPSPILSRKRRKIDPRQYSRWKRYRLGDEVIMGGKSWISLRDENQGEIPGFSGSWALLEKMTNFFSTWFNIYSPDAKIRLNNSIDDVSKINVPRYVKESVFSVYPNLGYLPETKSVIESANPDVMFNISYTENMNPLEKTYYQFYLTWGSIRPTPGSIINLPMKKKEIEPKIYIPYFLTKSSGGSGWFDYNNVKEVPLAGSGYYTIGEEIRVNLDPILRSIGNSQLDNNTLTYNLPKLKYYVEKVTENQGTSEAEIETVYSEDYEGVTITLIDTIDYEEGSYFLKVDWDYKKVTVSNSGDFAIEKPVCDIIRTQKYTSRIVPLPGTSLNIECLRIKLGNSDWVDDIPWSGRVATWRPSGEYNIVSLITDNERPGEYILTVDKVTEDIIIDIKTS